MVIQLCSFIIGAWSKAWGRVIWGKILMVFCGALCTDVCQVIWEFEIAHLASDVVLLLTCQNPLHAKKSIQFTIISSLRWCWASDEQMPRSDRPAPSDVNKDSLCRVDDQCWPLNDVSNVELVQLVYRRIHAFTLGRPRLRNEDFLSGCGLASAASGEVRYFWENGFTGRREGFADTSDLHRDECQPSPSIMTRTAWDSPWSHLQ